MVQAFVTDVLVNGEAEKIPEYINPTLYLQHNSAIADGLDGLGNAFQYFADNGLVLEYHTLHRVLGEGNFVLTVSEGKFGKGEHVSYYDLFRVEASNIVEHWDIIEPLLPQEEWKNSNGKF